MKYMLICCLKLKSEENFINISNTKFILLELRINRFYKQTNIKKSFITFKLK